MKLPSDVCAYASVKTSLCREGVLAINVRVVDPGWEGPLSSFLLNSGKDIYRLKAGEPFLRLTFHRITAVSSVASAVSNRSAYETLIEQKLCKRLSASFMDLDAAAKKGSERFSQNLKVTLLGYVPISALLLAALTFMVNLGTLKLANWTTPSEMVLTRAKALTTEAEEKTAKVEAENKTLKDELRTMTLRIDQPESQHKPTPAR